MTGLSVASWGQNYLADRGWRFIEKEKDVQELFWGSRRVNLAREML